MRFAELDSADEIFDLRQHGRRHAQFVNAQADEKRDGRGVTGHLAAQARPDAVAFAGLNGQLYQAQQGRMRGVVQVGDFFIQPIHRQRVLDEVIGADAEKLCACAQRIGDEYGGGNLNHHSHIEIRVERFALGMQFCHAFLQQLVGGIEFFNTGNHRVHQLHIAPGTGAEQGAKLGAENILAREAKPNGPPAEERIGFRGFSKGAAYFIRPNIEGAENHRLRRDRLRHALVADMLLLLIRQGVALKEQIFGAEESHALGPAF